MACNYTPEGLVEAVYEQYGIVVPLELAYTYCEVDPYLTPETMYYYMMSLNEE